MRKSLISHAVLEPWISQENDWGGSDVDGRARLATGGVAAIAVSVAVVWGVAMSNAAALSDTAGSRLALDGVVVPAPASVPASTATATPDAALVVPAPDPQTVVEPEQDAAPAEPIAQPAPAPAPQPAAPDPSAEEQRAVADEARASGRWDYAAEWAKAHGWSPEDIDSWRQREEAERAPRAPAQAGSESDRDHWWRDGSKNERSHDSPDRRD